MKTLDLVAEKFVKCAAKGCPVVVSTSFAKRQFYFCHEHRESMKEVKRKVYHDKSLKNRYLK
jgi:hypothetical protein